MYLYDEMDMCPTKSYNTNSDDHERRGQLGMPFVMVEQCFASRQS